MDELKIPNCEELRKGIEAFEINERRACVYFEAIASIHPNWGDIGKMAQGVEILLHGWHHAFYRFGDFDFDQLKTCIEENLGRITAFKDRDIFSLSRADQDELDMLGNQFLDALRGGNKRSPVAMAKALHLLAPNFFPLWDTDIAINYHSWWVYSDFGVLEYIPFCWKIRRVAEEVKNCECVLNPNPKRSLLKLIDEYNYSNAHKWL